MRLENGRWREVEILPIIMVGKEKRGGSILLLLLAIAALNQAQSAKKVVDIPLVPSVRTTRRRE